MASLSGRAGVTLLKLDVTNEKMIAQAVQSVIDETGRLDFLINNAGRNHFMPLLDESIENAKAIFDTNVWGALLLIKAFVPLLIAAKGTVVNITSVSGYINIPWMGKCVLSMFQESFYKFVAGTYAASKRSMELMAETLRLELLPFEVRVVSVVTATVKTNGLDYFDDLTLPEESLYKSIEATIRGRAQGSGSKNRMNANEYAQKVISRLVQSGATRVGPAGVIWGPGFLPSFIRIATAWLPTSILVRSTSSAQSDSF